MEFPARQPPGTPVSATPASPGKRAGDPTGQRQMRGCTLPRRLAAMLYDTLIVLAIWMVLTLLFVLIRGSAMPPRSYGFMFALALSAWAYFAWCWQHGGQTLGMRAWRIRLVAVDGPVKPAATLVRFLVAGLGALAAGLGFAWSLFHPDRAGWHDLASATRIVPVLSTHRRRNHQ